MVFTAERDVTTRFGADTSGFSKGVSEVVAQLDKYNKALVNNQQQTKKVTKEINELEKQQKELKSQMKNGGTEEQKKRYAELTKEIEQHRVKLAQLRTDQTRIKQVISETSEELKKEKDGFTVLKGTVSDLLASGIKKLASGLVDLGKDVIKTGEEFSSSMSEVRALSGATGEEFEKLKETAREYGATTVFSATEAAQALKYMSLAGWSSKESTEALGGILDLAAASGMDLASASDMVTDYLSAFGMEAKDSAYFADVLAYAQANSNTSAQQLGEAFQNCAANLNASGQDIETTTSLLEAMANQGLKGSMAGTALAAVMRDITAKMKNGKIAIGDTKIQVENANGSFRDLTDILKEVEKTTDKMGTAEKATALSTTFTADSIKGLNLILNEGMTSVSGYEEKLRNADGTAKQTANTMNDNLTGDIANLNSAFDELKLKIFDSAETPLRNFVQDVTEKGIPALEALINNFDKIIPVVIGATTATLGYKSAIGIQSVIDTVKTSLGSLKTAKVADKVATDAMTASQATNNAVVKANPYVLAATALLTFISLITTWIAVSNSASSAATAATFEVENYTQALNDAKSSAEQKKATTESEISLLNTQKKRYDELRKKVNLTAQEKKELDNIASDMAKTLGTTTDALKDESGAYGDVTKNVKKYIEQLRIKIQMENAQSILKEAYNVRDNGATEERVKAAKKAYDDYANEMLEKIKNSNTNLNDELKKGNITERQALHDKNAIEMLGGDYTKLTQLEHTYAELNHQRTTAISTIEEYENKVSGLYGKIDNETESQKKSISTTEELIKSTSNLSSAYQNVSKSGNLNSDTLQNLIAQYPELAKYISETGDTTLKNGEKIKEVYEQEQKALINNLQAKKDELEAEKESADSKSEIEKQISAINAQIEIYKNADIDNVDWSSITGEVKNLASAYQTLNGGKQLDVDTMKNLIDKYPEVASAMAKEGKLGKEQADVFKDLAETKKNDYIVSQQVALKNLEVSRQETIGVIKNLQSQLQMYLLKGQIMQAISVMSELGRQGINLNNIDSDIDKATARIKAIQNIDIDTYGKGGSGSDRNEALSNEIKQLEHKKALGQLTSQQEYDWLVRINNKYSKNADEQMDMEKRLYNAKKQMQADYEESLKKRYELAEAAYNKLVDKRIEKIKKEQEAKEKAKDKAIAAIDAEIEARKRLNEDKNLQKELNEVNAQLRYAQLDELSRRELERKRQDLLNEQAEIWWQRRASDKKDSLQNGYDSYKSGSDAMITALQKAANSAAEYFDELKNGYKSNAQIVNNNSDTRNIQIVSNALSNQQMLDKLLKAIYKK